MEAVSTTGWHFSITRNARSVAPVRQRSLPDPLYSLLLVVAAAILAELRTKDAKACAVPELAQ